ncbi:MAG: hypothetical protein KC431_19460, partial [Myxococcales bacterium]|nr:hypothetical protein [Myxococcales bacterium]
MNEQNPSPTPQSHANHLAQEERPDAATLAAASALLARVERESGLAPERTSLDVWMRMAAHACRAELAERMNETMRADRQAKAKRVHYLSMEFLMGR